MASVSVRGSWLACAVVVVAMAAGCGDDPSAPSTGGKLHPVPGCEAIDPSPCDVFDTSCTGPKFHAIFSAVSTNSSWLGCAIALPFLRVSENCPPVGSGSPGRGAHQAAVSSTSRFW